MRGDYIPSDYYPPSRDEDPSDDYPKRRDEDPSEEQNTTAVGPCLTPSSSTINSLSDEDSVLNSRESATASRESDTGPDEWDTASHESHTALHESDTALHELDAAQQNVVRAPHNSLYSSNNAAGFNDSSNGYTSDICLPDSSALTVCIKDPLPRPTSTVLSTFKRCSEDLVSQFKTYSDGFVASVKWCSNEVVSNVRRRGDDAMSNIKNWLSGRLASDLDCKRRRIESLDPQNSSPPVDRPCQKLFAPAPSQKSKLSATVTCRPVTVRCSEFTEGEKFCDSRNCFRPTIDRPSFFPRKIPQFPLAKFRRDTNSCSNKHETMQLSTQQQAVPYSSQHVYNRPHALVISMGGCVKNPATSLSMCAQPKKRSRLLFGEDSEDVEAKKWIGSTDKRRRLDSGIYADDSTRILPSQPITVCRACDQSNTSFIDTSEKSRGVETMDDIVCIQLGSGQGGRGTEIPPGQRFFPRRKVTGEVCGDRCLGELGGERNLIDVSYESSKRWLQRQAGTKRVATECTDENLTCQNNLRFEEEDQFSGNSDVLTRYCATGEYQRRKRIKLDCFAAAAELRLCAPNDGRPLSSQHSSKRKKSAISTRTQPASHAAETVTIALGCKLSNDSLMSCGSGDLVSKSSCAPDLRIFRTSCHDDGKVQVVPIFASLPFGLPSLARTTTADFVHWLPKVISLSLHVSPPVSVRENAQGCRYPTLTTNFITECRISPTTRHSSLNSSRNNPQSAGDKQELTVIQVYTCPAPSSIAPAESGGQSNTADGCLLPNPASCPMTNISARPDPIFSKSIGASVESTSTESVCENTAASAAPASSSLPLSFPSQAATSFVPVFAPNSAREFVSRAAPSFAPVFSPYSAADGCRFQSLANSSTNSAPGSAPTTYAAPTQFRPVFQAASETGIFGASAGSVPARTGQFPGGDSSCDSASAPTFDATFPPSYSFAAFGLASVAPQSAGRSYSSSSAPCSLFTGARLFSAPCGLNSVSRSQPTATALNDSSRNFSAVSQTLQCSTTTTTTCLSQSSTSTSSASSNSREGADLASNSIPSARVSSIVAPCCTWAASVLRSPSTVASNSGCDSRTSSTSDSGDSSTSGSIKSCTSGLIGSARLDFLSPPKSGVKPGSEASSMASAAPTLTYAFTALAAPRFGQLGATRFTFKPSLLASSVPLSSTLTPASSIAATTSALVVSSWTKSTEYSSGIGPFQTVIRSSASGFAPSTCQNSASNGIVSIPGLVTNTSAGIPQLPTTNPPFAMGSTSANTFDSSPAAHGSAAKTITTASNAFQLTSSRFGNTAERFTFGSVLSPTSLPGATGDSSPVVTLPVCSQNFSLTSQTPAASSCWFGQQISSVTVSCASIQTPVASNLVFGNSSANSQAPVASSCAFQRSSSPMNFGQNSHAPNTYAFSFGQTSSGATDSSTNSTPAPIAPYFSFGQENCGQNLPPPTFIFGQSISSFNSGAANAVFTPQFGSQWRNGNNNSSSSAPPQTLAANFSSWNVVPNSSNFFEPSIISYPSNQPTNLRSPTFGAFPVGFANGSAQLFPGFNGTSQFNFSHPVQAPASFGVSSSASSWQSVPFGFCPTTPSFFNASSSPSAFNTSAPLAFNTGTPLAFNTSPPLVFNSSVPLAFNSSTPLVFNTSAPSSFNANSTWTFNTFNTGTPFTFNTSTPFTFNTTAPLFTIGSAGTPQPRSMIINRKRHVGQRHHR